MSLIDRVRGVEPLKRSSHKPRHIESSLVEYKPMFLGKALRNGFVMHIDTLEIEKMECFRKEKRELFTWLLERGLRIKESSIKDHVVIFR